MHDIKAIRENPAEFDKQLARRNISPLSEHILKLDKARRAKLQEVETLQARRNAVAKEIGMAKSKGGDASQLLAEAEEIKQKIAAFEAAQENDDLAQQLAVIPNLLQDSVPQGKDESENKEIIKWGEPHKFNFTPKPHDELGEKLGYMDFEQTSKICGGALYHAERPAGKNGTCTRRIHA